MLPATIQFISYYIKYTYNILPLGDTALLLSFGNIISRETNRYVIAIHNHFKANPFYGLTDVVVAYSSITFLFDMFAIRQSLRDMGSIFEWVQKQVEQPLHSIETGAAAATRLVMIPLCYHHMPGTDLDTISNITGLHKEAIIEIHCSKKYYVYQHGFLPGFAYMGEVDPRIEIPRKDNPTIVTPGSVAIAGKQTGIYPLKSYGGWQVLGYTPIAMFNATLNEPCFLTAGNEVQFYPIGLEEYKQLLNEKPNK